jgi:hypothetical protein
MGAPSLWMKENEMSNINVNDPNALTILHDKLIAAHRAFYTADPKEQLSPMIIFYTPDGTGTAVSFHMDGGEDNKAYIAQKMKAMFAEQNVQMYAFFAEAWAAAYDKGKVDVMPSKREDRKEIVCTLVVHRDGRKMCSATEINRDWESGGAVLGKVENSGDSFGGRFAELFDE